jgi:hypothetical protein
MHIHLPLHIFILFIIIKYFFRVRSCTCVTCITAPNSDFINWAQPDETLRLLMSEHVSRHMKHYI